MKLSFTILATLFLASPLLHAAAPVPPAIPAVLEPLKAKLEHNSPYEGWILRARAEEPVTEAQWKAIEGLGVQGIAIGGKGIDNDSIARMSTMNLTVLGIDGGPKVTDDFAQYVAKMKSLRRFNIGHMLQKEFTGKTFSLLKDLPALESLGFGGSATAEDAVEAVGQLTQLKELHHWHSRESDPRNLYLLKLTNLKVLQLGRNGTSRDHKTYVALTNATLDTLAQMKSLENVSLMEFRPRLAALEKLKALPNLKTLNLSESVDISAEDIKKLSDEMPGVKVLWRPMTEAQRKHLDLVTKDDVAEPEAGSPAK